MNDFSLEQSPVAVPPEHEAATPEPRLPLLAMHDEALQILEAKGVDATVLNPAVLILAKHGKDAKRAMEQNGVRRAALALGDAVSPLRGRIAGDDSPDATDRLEKAIAAADEELQVARGVDSAIRRMGRRARMRSMAFVALAAAGAASISVGVVGETKYDIRAGLHTAQPVIGDPLVPKSAMVWDESILPGDMGAHTPVINVLRKAIPGIPDFADFAADNRVYTTEIEKVPTTVVEAYSTSGLVGNPVARNLELTGKEYEQARKTAGHFLDTLKHDKVSANQIVITGNVSDELDGKVGEVDERQVPLAWARAKIAADALTAEAKARNQKLPQIVLETHEKVLTPAEVEQVEHFAVRENISVASLLDAYNDGGAMPDDIRKGLDALLAAGRTTELKAVGTHDVAVQRMRVIDAAHTERKTYVNDISGEAVGSVLGVPILLFGAALVHGMRFVRSAQRRAQRKVRKAGISL